MTNQKAFTPALPNRRYGPSATQRRHLLGLKGSQRRLRASHRRRKPPSEASWRLLHFASSSLAHIRDGAKGRRQELPLCCLSLPLRRRRCAMEAAESHSWSCFASQPKLGLSSHFHFWFTYPFVAQVPMQIKVRCFIFLSSQSLGIKLFIRQLVSLLTNTHAALARLQAGAPSPLNVSGICQVTPLQGTQWPTTAKLTLCFTSSSFFFTHHPLSSLSLFSFRLLWHYLSSTTQVPRLISLHANTCSFETAAAVYSKRTMREIGIKKARVPSVCGRKCVGKKFTFTPDFVDYGERLLLSETSPRPCFSSTLHICLINNKLPL